jgi:hypothetical protein
MNGECNFKIVETEEAWRAVFFPFATDLRLVEKEKYKLMLGGNDRKLLPKWLDYYKKYYTKEDAIGYASKINECKICMWIANLERAMTEITGKPTIVLFENFEENES